MEEPVDLTNFRGMTGGDTAMEQELFREFLSSFEKGLKSLQENIAPTMADVWHLHAHSLRGTSLNLGAKKLGDLCKKAQNDDRAPVEAKNTMLENIRAEYEQVRQFLLTIMV